MSHDLPPVSSTTDAFLSVLAQRQDATNALLAQILDRLPKPAMVDAAIPGTVELREPQAKPEPSPRPAQTAAPVATARKRATRKGA